MAHGHNKNFAEHFEFALDRVFTSAQPIPSAEWVATHLTLDGDGSTISMVVDGTTPKRFQYVVPADKHFILSRVVWSCVDLDIVYTDWFGFGSALTNGCVFRAMDVGGTDLLHNFLHPLRNTLEFSHLAGADLPLLTVNRGVIPDVLVVRWSLFKAGFVPIFEPSQIVEFLIQDNLSEMDHFEVVIQGRIFDA